MHWNAERCVVQTLCLLSTEASQYHPENHGARALVREHIKDNTIDGHGSLLRENMKDYTKKSKDTLCPPFVVIW